MRLNLGVLDVAYGDAEGAATTGEVAESLEKRYGVMGAFAGAKEGRIADWLAEATADALLDLLMRGKAPRKPFLGAEQKIESSFREFLFSYEVEQFTGPTEAALQGRTKRRKSGYGPRRPSFVDTSLYANSFRAWVEGFEKSAGVTESRAVMRAASAYQKANP